VRNHINKYKTLDLLTAVVGQNRLWKIKNADVSVD